MLFVVGLGNPESRYEGTRHNVGFDVVDRLAKELKIGFRPGRGEYMIALSSHQGQAVGLVKPLSYMNQSGIPVLDIQERFAVSLDRLLVVCDDFQLPLGRLRLRAKGSDGGHNGLYSIIYHLQSEDFPRLRCGIASEFAPKEKVLMAEYVLDPFTQEERPPASAMVERAKDACLCVLADGLQKAMNIYNKSLGV